MRAQMRAPLCITDLCNEAMSAKDPRDRAGQSSWYSLALDECARSDGAAGSSFHGGHAVSRAQGDSCRSLLCPATFFRGSHVLTAELIPLSACFPPAPMPPSAEGMPHARDPLASSGWMQAVWMWVSG